jgi:hypothetical protein
MPVIYGKRIQVGRRQLAVGSRFMVVAFFPPLDFI